MVCPAQMQTIQTKGKLKTKKKRRQEQESEKEIETKRLFFKSLFIQELNK